MYKEQLEDLKINQVIKVFENPQVWRNNATRLHKETQKLFHIKKMKDHTMIIRIL
jgi:hypothetical protein